MPKGLRIIHEIVGDRNLTSFGGFFLIQRFCRRLGIERHLRKTVRFGQRHSRYHPVDLTLTILYALILGISRLSKTRTLQGNGVFQRIVGVESFPFASSLRRFLKRLDQQSLRDLNQVHDDLRRNLFSLPRRPTSLLFDLDSTVLPIYGKSIEGAKVGYNPRKRGTRSYQPVLAFEYHRHEFWHGSLRPGDVHPAADALDFLRACIAKIPPYVYRFRLRADAGFFGHEFLTALELAQFGYVIVARLTQPLKREVVTLRYRRFRKDWAVAEFRYRPFNWPESRRFVVIRRPIPDKDDEQLTLFHNRRFSYQVFVTNLKLRPEKVWHFYRARAAIELNIRELKESYALAKIPTRSLIANQVYFSLLLLAYNVVNWFKRLCLSREFEHALVETIRRELLAVPARLARTHNRNVLRLPPRYVRDGTIRRIIRQIDAIRPEQFEQFAKRD